MFDSKAMADSWPVAVGWCLVLHVAALTCEDEPETLWDPEKKTNPPAPKVLGRDLPDGTRKRLQVYLGGIFRPKPCVFDRSLRSPSKNSVKNSTEDTCS